MAQQEFTPFPSAVTVADGLRATIQESESGIESLETYVRQVAEAREIATLLQTVANEYGDIPAATGFADAFALDKCRHAMQLRIARQLINESSRTH